MTTTTNTRTAPLRAAELSITTADGTVLTATGDHELATRWAEHEHGPTLWATLSLCAQWRTTADALDALRRAHAAANGSPLAEAGDVDPGCATSEQLELICDEQRADDPEQARWDADAQILADTRNTLTLPGVHVPGGFPVKDGTDYAAALIAFLTPHN